MKNQEQKLPKIKAALIFICAFFFGIGAAYFFQILLF